MRNPTTFTLSEVLQILKLEDEPQLLANTKYLLDWLTGWQQHQYSIQVQNEMAAIAEAHKKCNPGIKHRRIDYRDLWEGL